VVQELPNSVNIDGAGDSLSAAPEPVERREAGRRRAFTRRSKSSLAWALIAFFPFALYCVRVIANRGHIYLLSDVAVLDMNMRNAANFHQLLGPFSRFGLHHPGPVFVYLASFVARLIGLSHGAQALVVTAALVAGLSLAATVYVLGQMGGTSVAVAATVGSLLVALLTTDQLEVDPWNPYVIALPLVLFGILMLWTMRGSATALAAMLVVGSYEVQTDYGTGIYVVALTAAALVVLVARHKLGGLVRGWKAPVLLAIAGVMWVPPLIDQFTSAHPNLSALASFVTSHHPHAGLVGGASATGWASTFALGASDFRLQPDRGLGLLWLLLAAGGIAAVALVARLLHQRTAAQLALVALASLGVAVVAASQIVGPPYTYLMAWSAAAVCLGIVALVLLFAPVLARKGALAIGAVVLALGGATAKFSFVSSSGVGWTAPAKSPVFRALRQVEGKHPPSRIAVDFDDPVFMQWAFGICDALELSSIACTVPAGYYRFILGPGHGLPATHSVFLAEPGHMPTGYRVITTVQSSLGPFQVGWQARAAHSST
jgi:hypothetical protein